MGENARKDCGRRLKERRCKESHGQVGARAGPQPPFG